MNQAVNPSSLSEPVGFSYAVRSATSRIVWLGGHVAFNAEGKIVGPQDMVGQFKQTIANIEMTMQEAGGTLEDIVKMTIYVTDKNIYKEHLKAIGWVYRGFFGKYFPAMTLVEVSSLFEDDAMIEIEAVAVLP